MMPSRARGRPPKVKKQFPESKCIWCRNTFTTKPYLVQMRTFCSHSCAIFYRNAYRKGACSDCENPIQNVVELKVSSNESKNFCSNTCLEKFKKTKLSEDKKKRENSNTELPPSPHSKGNAVFIDWETYLKDTNSEAAPVHSFKQYPTPPANDFEKNMKLEAKDNRNPTSTCLATVVEKLGPRLKLRLDGNDTSNDFWRLVDSRDIAVYGTVEKRGGMLQPPFGFQHNPSSFNSFLKKSLNGAIIAPASLFVKDPHTPKGNYFKPGHKLEAIDPHCPNYISVATIDNVNDDEISVIFDGCNKSYGFNCKYYSRDIFPVGWCEKCDHPLQHGRKITVPRKGKVKNLNLPPILLPEEPEYKADCQDIKESPISSPVTLIEADTSSRVETQTFACMKSECESTSNEDNAKYVHDDPPNQKEVTTITTTVVLRKADGKVLITEKEPATSTTPAEGAPKLPCDPSEWSVENVISFISHVYPTLIDYSDIFRTHEIDGKALLLLKYDTMMKYMGLKLGPAVKICGLVSKLENRRQIF